LKNSGSKPVLFKLDDVKEWEPGISCTLTALAAISGKTPRQIHQHLKASATTFGVEIPDSFLVEYNINHWLKAIQLLGGQWDELLTQFASVKFRDRPTIATWMFIPKDINLRLVFCDANDKHGHVFATFDDKIVDEYTKGKIEKFNAATIPKDWPELRVKREFYVY
jgi:hypothetical protein